MADSLYAAFQENDFPMYRADDGKHHEFSYVGNYIYVISCDDEEISTYYTLLDLIVG